MGNHPMMVMREGTCFCGGQTTGRICRDCYESVSVTQARYIDQFQRFLHTGRGIDLALEIANDLTRFGAVTYRRRDGTICKLSPRQQGR